MAYWTQFDIVQLSNQQYQDRLEQQMRLALERGAILPFAYPEQDDQCGHNLPTLCPQLQVYISIQTRAATQLIAFMNICQGKRKQHLHSRTLL